MSALLELKDVNKAFGGVQAVRDMSFVINKGELAGLIGPNGAGKTTIFNLVTGVYDVTSGDIVFKGESIAKLKTFQVISRGIARTFQNLRLFAASSVLENVMTAAQQHYKYNFFEAVTHLGRWKSREAATRKESMELLDRVGLADRADQAAGTLPYGLQRRLEIARAISLQPELLLLDEPAAGMNADEVVQLNELITGIHRDFNLTILLIEHHMDMVMAICPHIVCMNFGAKIAEGSPAEIQSHPTCSRPTSERRNRDMTENRTPILAVRDLVVRYGAIQALKGASLDVYPGEIVAVIGANGAGKSTMMNAIMGDVPRVSGEILLDGVALPARASRSSPPASAFRPKDARSSRRSQYLKT